MEKSKTAAVILAAGQGMRMKSAHPKVLHPLAGRPMIAHLLATLAGVRFERAVVVVGPDMDAVGRAVAPWPTVIQPEPLGTADALKAARGELEGFDGIVLVLYGDTPLITAATLRAMIDAFEACPDTAAVVLGFRPADPGEYGRLVAGVHGALEAIVEAGEASAAERRIALCNSGVMALSGRSLFARLDQLTNTNAKGEYFLTDVVALARADGLACRYIEAPEAELLGINSRAELAHAEAVVQAHCRAAAMAGGATLVAPETVFFSHDTRLGRDVLIGPDVVFGAGVSVGDGVQIRAFCHIEGAVIADGAVIGPFARLRPGAEIGPDAHIGNFVEVKQAVIEAGAKANHLSYIGDARVGARANVGAGTITCNYDGFLKSHTDIGAEAFIGSNTALVAPVTIGDRAIIGAGSTISRDVPADALALTRAKQDERAGWASSYRARKRAEKARKAAVAARGKAAAGD